MRTARLGVAAAVLAVTGALAPFPVAHGPVAPLGQHDNGITAAPAGHHDNGAMQLAGALRPAPWDSHGIHFT